MMKTLGFFAMCTGPRLQTKRDWLLKEDTNKFCTNEYQDFNNTHRTMILYLKLRELFMFLSRKKLRQESKRQSTGITWTFPSSFRRLVGLHCCDWNLSQEIQRASHLTPEVLKVHMLYLYY